MAKKPVFQRRRTSVPYTIAGLVDEINNDPAKLGYRKWVDLGADADIANILNDRNGPGAGPADAVTLPRDDMIHAILPSVLALGNKSAEVKDKWDRILGVLKSVNSVPLDTAILPILTELVTDGLLDPAVATMIGKVQGSRAEVLWGVGTNITHQQVAQAVRG